jgi:hypothetical protein
VLVDKSGKITGLVLGVGGFLGAGEKDVVVPFTAVKTAKKNDKWWLTIDETKDTLKETPGFKYDKASTHLGAREEVNRRDPRPDRARCSRSGPFSYPGGSADKTMPPSTIKSTAA